MLLSWLRQFLVLWNENDGKLDFWGFSAHQELLTGTIISAGSPLDLEPLPWHLKGRALLGKQALKRTLLGLCSPGC